MKHLICIAGPTAAGKTTLSIELAKQFGTAVLSADSRQMYRYMDIGTAKPTPEERQGIPHYFIDTLDPDEEYSAGRFEADADKLLKTLFVQNEVVICVGGSTLYYEALWNGMDDMPAIPEDIRNQLNLEFRDKGLESLVSELSDIDPPTFSTIDRQNPARVIRALEVFRATGQPISSFRIKKEKQTDWEIIKIGLTDDRPMLYRRIDARVLEMIRMGLLEEVGTLLERGYSPDLASLQSIGYQEIISHLQGNISQEEAIRLIQRNSRRYAKRQLTWFRRYEDMIWFQAGKISETVSQVLAMVKK